MQRRKKKGRKERQDGDNFLWKKGRRAVEEQTVLQRQFCRDRSVTRENSRGRESYAEEEIKRERRREKNRTSVWEM
jgi:hypothetical protein